MDSSISSKSPDAAMLDPPPPPDLGLSPHDLQKMQGPLILIDVRRRGVFARAADMVDGAAWRDPEYVATWADELPRDRPVVVYCVHGLDVGRFVAGSLRVRGFNARFIAGGIAAWRESGGRTTTPPRSAG
jgi:Fe-Mn family superoxide dismutase